MSTTTKEIIEKLKTLTLLEAVDLVQEIENTFGVDTTMTSNLTTATSTQVSDQEQESSKQQTEFNVILEKVPGEDQKSKRLSIFRLIREFTALGLKEAKDLTNQLPTTLKESVSKEQADEIKRQFEEAGAQIQIQ